MSTERLFISIPDGHEMPEVVVGDLMTVERCGQEAPVEVVAIEGRRIYFKHIDGGLQ